MYKLELSIDMIAQMLYLELKLRNITMTEDENTLTSILASGAELIYHGCNARDIANVVEEIKDYVSSTLNNYPNYFTTGEVN